jgi:UDP-N-acetylmuramoyl-tripeptide--D-alanyl-D-alanine ligase
MRAALRALSAMRHGRRAIAIVGEMRELGADSTIEHERVGRLAAELGVDEVVAVGPGAAPAAQAFAAVRAGAGRQIEQVDDAAHVVESMLAAGDVVLLKSSRDSGLRFLGETLAAGGVDP